MREERARHPVDKVITGKDIQALRIKEEDLTKVKGRSDWCTTQREICI